MKDFHTIIPMPNRPTQIALIDPDKSNVIDIKTKKFVRSILKWGGRCTRDGKYGLFAPSRGGLEIIELRHGKSVKTLIPKVSENKVVVDTPIVFTRQLRY